MTYCFAFNPGKGLRWAPPPFSKLLNFFICNVFKMLYEKVIILFTVTIFFTVTVVIACWWCISVKLLFYSQRYEQFSLFTRLLLIICRSNVTSLMSSFCIFVVYFCSCCFFLFLFDLFLNRTTACICWYFWFTIAWCVLWFTAFVIRIRRFVSVYWFYFLATFSLRYMIPVANGFKFWFYFVKFLIGCILTSFDTCFIAAWFLTNILIIVFFNAFSSFNTQSC